MTTTLTTELTLADVTDIAYRHADRYERFMNETLAKFDKDRAEAKGGVTDLWISSFLLDGLAEIAGAAHEITRLRSHTDNFVKMNVSAEAYILGISKIAYPHIRQVARTNGSTSAAENLVQSSKASFWAGLLDSFDGAL